MDVLIDNVDIREIHVSMSTPKILGISSREISEVGFQVSGVGSWGGSGASGAVLG